MLVLSNQQFQNLQILIQKREKQQFRLFDKIKSEEDPEEAG